MLQPTGKLISCVGRGERGGPAALSPLFLKREAQAAEGFSRRERTRVVPSETQAGLSNGGDTSSSPIPAKAFGRLRNSVGDTRIACRRTQVHFTNHR